MKHLVIKACLLFVLFGSICMESNAQRRRSRRDQSAATQTQPNNDQQAPPGNTGRPNINVSGNIPIEVAPAAVGNSFEASPLPSARPDDAFDKGSINDRTPLPYEHLRWDDALFAEKVWREIDLREKMNMPFRYAAEDNGGSQKFISILLRAVLNGDVTAFDANVDDRFTTPLDSMAVRRIITGSDRADTTPVYNLQDPTKIDKYVVTYNTFNPDDVMKFRIKEEWVFDREASRMFVRILGIAPLKISRREDGEERGAAPMFWIYYPDLRPILAKHEVYNPKNMGNARMTWEELFESRMFSSYIVKSTLDNPLNKNIRSVIKDPILALLEGDNVKERIFNYEQDLWQY